MVYENGRYFAALDERTGLYDIFGRANYRPTTPQDNGCGSGSVFCLAHARTEAGARYQVDCYAGKQMFSTAEFQRLGG